MSTFKVQKIAQCENCGDLLSLKCKACTKCPVRKPRIIELYDWPEILKTAECGCCIQVRCQFPTCSQTTWKNVSKNRDRKCASKGVFCSIVCTARSMTLARTKRKMVPCAYCEKMVMKKMYILKSNAHSFCNTTCYFLFRRKSEHEAKEGARILKKEMENLSMLQCSGSKCRGEITEHRAVERGVSACVVCKATRSDRVALS